MKYYRLLTMLPPLPTRPERPPQPLGVLLESCLGELGERDLEVAHALLGQFDCRNLEALLSGYETFDDRGLLSRTALAQRTDLPDYLLSFLQAHETGRIPVDAWQDALWQAYYTHLLEVAEQSGSGFLREWAGFELSLRVKLVPWRAERIGNRPLPGLPGAPAAESDDFAPLLIALREETNPMERERLLDRRRMEKLDALAGVDPFSSEAALAYVATCLVLDRWDLDERVDPAELLEAVA